MVRLVVSAAVAVLCVACWGGGAAPIASATTSGPNAGKVVPGGCGKTVVRTGGAPSWISLSGAPDWLPYAIATPATAAADIFGYPLEAGHPEKPANKILWVVGADTVGGLNVTVHPLGAGTPALDWALSPAGRTFPSIDDVPNAGCWHFDLSNAGRHWSIDLEYGPAATPG